MNIRSATALGAAIRDRRTRLGLDQSGLARRIGVTRQWVIAIERGKDSAELGLVLRALAALDLTVDVSGPAGVKSAGKRTPPKGLPAVDIDTIVSGARKQGRAHG